MKGKSCIINLIYILSLNVFFFEKIYIFCAAENENLEQLLHMSKDEMKSRMNIIFSVIDTDKNDILDDDELRKYTTSIHDIVNVKHGQTELEMADKDADGFVSFEEIKLAHLDYGDTEKSADDLKKRFDIVDMDKDEKLNAAEMAVLLNPVGNDALMRLEIETIFATHDKNGDKLLSLEELTMSDSPDEILEEEMAQIKDEFKSYDLDSDGFVSEDEIRNQIVAGSSATEISDGIKKMYIDPEQQTISKEEWNNNYEKYIISPVTDNGELIRFPHDYDPTLPFNNIEKNTENNENNNDEDNSSHDDEYLPPNLHEEL